MIDGVAFDVVVVGAGVAGLACALAAGERGARVALVDSAPTAGGTAAVASAGACFAGTALQRRLGIEDSPDRALGDWVAWGGPTVDVEWARRYLDNSVTEVFVRLSELGITWGAVYREEGNSVARWHEPVGGGVAVMAALERRARTTPTLSWHLGHRARRILREGGRVRGVLATHATGETVLRAPSVVIATGGFCNSREQVAAYARTAGAERVLLGGGIGAGGDGHRLLDEVGAQFVNLDRVWMYPYATPDPGRPGTDRGLALRGLDGDVWVNDDGLRFHDESRRGGATGTPALLSQPYGRGWAIIDARVAARMTVSDPSYRRGTAPLRERINDLLTSSPHIVSAPDLRRLAERMGVDAANLEESVGRMNAAIGSRADRDPDFGKPLAGLSALDAAPYHALRLHPLARKNLGGVRTDLDACVLDARDRPIPGLFAAGEVAGMAGGRINGDAALEGTMFGPSMLSGVVAGSTALGDTFTGTPR